jgi:uncharacterized protein YndB with AHSA1/START domain
MAAPGHCEVRLTRRYDASPAEVWAALTEPGSIARWLAPVVALELTPGGALQLAIGVDARVLAIEPQRLLELDWRYGGEAPSVVRVELAPDGDGTLLSLDHRRIDARIGMAYISRWTGVLARFAGEVGGR